MSSNRITGCVHTQCIPKKRTHNAVTVVHKSFQEIQLNKYLSGDTFSDSTSYLEELIHLEHNVTIHPQSLLIQGYSGS